MEVMDFFKSSDGRTAKLYRLRNKSGFEVDITDFGGALVSIRTPDRNGKSVDVLLGFGNPADYEENDPFSARSSDALRTGSRAGASPSRGRSTALR